MKEKTFFKGEWKAVEKLGEGSFGIVYKAIKEQYGVESYSAIKQIMIPQTDEYYSKLKSQGMTQSDIEKSYDSQVKKWVEEIQFLNQFKDNENVVSIEDFEVLERRDKPGRTINIRMELLQNIDDHVMDRIITDKKVLKMASDILKALEECEEKNVVHRDIKPENVFVNSKGTYKLGDFGEAKSIEKTVSNMSKKGTENYMAPEIYKGERGSRSVDTYSLGIMLYKYFNNNRLPFIPDYPNQITFEDMESALEKRMSGKEMKPPVKASNRISRIILKACSYKPEDRYKSAMEFRNDIEEELRAITNPMKLFDFQEDKIQEENINECNYDKTESVFSDFTKQKHDKTVGIFLDDEIEDKLEQIDRKDDKVTDISTKKNNSKINTNIENTNLTEDNFNPDNKINKKQGLNKKTIKNIVIYTIAIIALLIITLIIVNTNKSKNTSSDNDEEYIELIATEGTEKIELENLSALIPYDFKLDSVGNYSSKTSKNIKEKMLNIDIYYTISINARNKNETREDLTTAEAYIKTFISNNEKYQYSEISNVEINNKTWLKMREKYTSNYESVIRDYYVIVYDDIIYYITFRTRGVLDFESTYLYKTAEVIENYLDMNAFDKTMNSFTLNKKVSNIKTIDKLKITVPQDVTLYEKAWYTKKETDETNMINYDYWLQLEYYGIDSDKDVKTKMKTFTEREQKNGSNIENIKEEKINEVKWSVLKAYNKKEEQIKYYYGIDIDKTTYIIEFDFYVHQYNKTEKIEIDEGRFEKFINSIKSTIIFE